MVIGYFAPLGDSPYSKMSDDPRQRYYDRMMMDNYMTRMPSYTGYDMSGRMGGYSKDSLSYEEEDEKKQAN